MIQIWNKPNSFYLVFFIIFMGTRKTDIEIRLLVLIITYGSSPSSLNFLCDRPRSALENRRSLFFSVLFASLLSICLCAALSPTLEQETEFFSIFQSGFSLYCTLISDAFSSSVLNTCTFQELIEVLY